jgi:hypothetical protein
MSSGACARRRRAFVVLRDAALISAVCAALAIGVNAVRGDGIALVADQPYQILVPCPEPLGEVDPLAPAEALASDAESLLVDARDAAAFAAWHLPAARHVPFDWLDQTPAATVDALAASGARRLIVYGDGAEPDSGRELARELAGRGLRNVYYVEGGAPALKAAAGGAPAPGAAPAGGQP